MNVRLLRRIKDVLTPTEAASKRKVYIFIICLVCSALFWLFIKLSQDNQAAFNRTVAFQNFPDDKLSVSQSDSLVFFRLESTGLRLILARFFLSEDVLWLDADALPVTSRNDIRYHYVTEALLIEYLEEKLEGRARVIDLYPDTIYLEMAPAIRKHLPVLLDADISFERRFEQYGAITIEPDSITVVGPKPLLDTLSFIQTEYWEARNLRKTTQRNLKIKQPIGFPSLEIKKEEVTVNVPVEEFTEATKELKIQLVCPDDLPPLDVRFFPNTVTVNYLVALRDYQAVSETMFHAAVGCPQAIDDENGRLPVTLEKYPSFVDVLYYRPQFVEYIILE